MVTQALEIKAGGSKIRTFIRTLLAGPVVLVVTLCVFLALPLWLPAGPGKVDNLVIPVLIFPIIWVGLFIHACLDRKLLRVALMAVGLLIINGSMIALKFTGLAF